MRILPVTAAAAMAFLTVPLPLTAQEPAAASAATTPLAIVGATIIDGNGGPPLADGTLLIEGNRITAVGPSSSIVVPEGFQVIDGAGRYVTPGFIDTNVHLSLYSGHETLVRYQDRNAALTLEAAGVGRGVVRVRQRDRDRGAGGVGDDADGGDHGGDPQRGDRQRDAG